MINKGYMRELEEFDKRISEIDQFATMVLKAHFLIEEQLDATLEAAAKGPKYLDLERATFAQKVKWVRAFAPEGDNFIWPVIVAINTVRNKVAHHPDGSERKNAMENLWRAWERTFAQASGRKPDRQDWYDEHLILVASMDSIGLLKQIQKLVRE